MMANETLGERGKLAEAYKIGSTWVVKNTVKERRTDVTSVRTSSTL